MVKFPVALSGLLALFHSTLYSRTVLADDQDVNSLSSFESKCSSFSLQGVSGASVTKTKYYANGTTVKLSSSMSSIDTDDLPDFCRIELTITTNSTANSSCNTEVWLPSTWNGRFLTVGNGGFAGGVNVGDLGYVAVNQSYQGHTSSITSAAWAGPHDDNAIVDWGWRAMHFSVVVGKEVVKQYYGSAHKKAYYIGCSQGGRSGFKEMQSFPDDFDGLVIGSPAAWHSHLRMWAGHLNNLVQPNTSDRYIEPAVWDDVIHKEVLKQCDAIDGLSDGIINDPRLCNLNTSALLCQSGQNASTCLSSTQVETFEKIYSDYIVNGDWVFGSWYPGGELGYSTSYVEKPSVVSQSWFRYMLLNDTTWPLGDYNSSLIAVGDAIDPGQSDAIDANLTTFAGSAHNGKLLHYVGWADQIISPGASIHYYDSVKNYTQDNMQVNIDDFYRLFMVPGMEHCYGGDGANAFGSVQQADSNMPPLNHEPEYDVLAAMVQWVEEGIAPSSLNAVHYKDNDVKNGIDAIRPLCQYPESLYYTGSDQMDPGSYTCKVAN
ncbi:feruloyl esterase-like protein [Fomitopsis serialis]|uniref:feruloyl esterase-like protein n=1 Tax=Fomitopsis serialis TaxID=139415 RepID=UPI002007C859|nr:feruloyl esterase-like protein [Neoantrodia serialis]KAH9917042.1 feruloyl esterase-like protein [Neoantrodia serialis]